MHLLLCCLLGIVLAQVSAVPPDNCPGDFDAICRTDFRYRVTHDWIPYANDSSGNGIRWRMLYDQYDYQNIFGEFNIPPGKWKVHDADGNGNGWVAGGGGTCTYQARVNSYRRTNPNNWYFTQAIAYCDAQELIVNATVRFSSCTQRPTCSHDYVIMQRYDTNSTSEVERIDPDNYHYALENLSDSKLQQEGTSGDTLIVKRFPRPNAANAYFGVQDIGTIGQLNRMFVYYKVCQKNEKGLVVYPEIPLPSASDANGRTMRLAKCVEHAHNITSLETYAYSDEDCEQDVTCKCDDGYETSANLESCSPCDKGYYKSAYNTTCVPCPENTKQDTEAATFCECKDGFFRADHEGVGVDCTAPPGPIPNELKIATTCDTTVELEWHIPEDVGRDDFYYDVSRSNPDTEETIVIEPRLMDTGEIVTYKVTGLKPKTTYTFSVCVHNGVSEHDSENDKLRVVTTQGTTKQGSVFMLSNVALSNNSAVLREDIGEGDKALICQTLSDDQCHSGDSSTPEIHYPNGTKISSEGTLYLTYASGMVALNRKDSDMSKLGEYSCRISDVNGNVQKIFVKIATMVNVVCPTTPLAAGCPALGDPDKGTVAISTEDINTGSIATYTCNEGLMLMGSATRECQSDGTWSGEEPKCELTGVAFELNGQFYSNNSQISFSLVGDGDSALRCVTDGDCCTPPNRAGEFYFPDGSQVRTLAVATALGHHVYRNRGEKMIRLNHRDLAGDGPPTGNYTCEIPDSTGQMKTLVITLT